MLTPLTLLIQAAADPTASVPFWGSLGVGGGLAGLIFWFYREDRKTDAARWAARDAEQVKLNDRLITIIESNTRAMTALEKTIEDQHAR